MVASPGYNELKKFGSDKVKELVILSQFLPLIMAAGICEMKATWTSFSPVWVTMCCGWV